MTVAARELFLADRVRALATVILTRRDGLSIAETKQCTGLDLHVYIDREDKPMRLAFGVLLRGVSSPMTADHANKVLGPTMEQFQGMRKFTYSVCLFFFTMRDERAYFSWLAKPVLTGAPKLVHHGKADCAELTDDLLGQVVRADRGVVRRRGGGADRVESRGEAAWLAGSLQAGWAQKGRGRES
jgi:hypothetical protein